VNRFVLQECGDGLGAIRNFHVAVNAHVSDARVSQQRLADVQSRFEQRKHNCFFDGFPLWGFLFRSFVFGFFLGFRLGSPGTILREFFQFL
jgi:hypothetical protein